MIDLNLKKIAVIGLGYVGLPLAVEFGKKFPTIGFDIQSKRIDALIAGHDSTLEVTSDILFEAKHLTYTTKTDKLHDCNYYIITVPTPVDSHKKPNLTPLIEASKTVGNVLKQGDVVIYESTVYPGATEEVCVPVLEQHSNLKWQEDFNIGYSPERVNPGDKEHTITQIVKVVSGDNEATLERIANLYEQVITAGVFKTSSLKVAEAAKVIENTQRDLNIALMNELAIIFDKMGIDTKEVLAAAGTKWNFIPFYPGLVGGHCIGVDPYYLTYKSDMLGYHPEIILAGRRINDGMAEFVANQTIKQMIKSGISIKNSKVTILGLTFKENCPDIRNSKVIRLIHELQEFGCQIEINDPIANPENTEDEYNLTLTQWDELHAADAIIAAVPHRFYLSMPLHDILTKLKSGGVFLDIKSAFDREEITKAGINLWRL